MHTHVLARVEAVQRAARDAARVQARGQHVAECRFDVFTARESVANARQDGQLRGLQRGALGPAGVGAGLTLQLRVDAFRVLCAREIATPGAGPAPLASALRSALTMP